MRFALAILAIAAVLAAGAASARLPEEVINVPEEMKSNPPPGSYWDEGLGLFVLDPPITLGPPEQALLTVDEDIIYFDDGTIRFYVPQQEDIFPLVKFPMRRPPCDDGSWVLTSVWVGVYDLGEPGEIPDPGEIVIYDHEPGDCIGEVLGFADFQPEPFFGDPLEAKWQQVDFYPWVTITEDEFWVAWDYRPGNTPPDMSVYTVGGYFEGLPPEERARSFLVPPYPCPLGLGQYYGVWLLRAFGHCNGPMVGHPIDIKPQSCPNPLGVKDRGVIPVAILGTMDFDVGDIDPSTISLEGVPPLRWAFEDVAEPFPGELCDCWTNGADGYADLTLKFDAQELVAALGDIHDGDVLELTLSWALRNGTQMTGSDCMIVRAKGKGPQSYVDRFDNGRFALFQNSPNPFKSGTSICFSLPEKSHTTLTVHDITGRLVSVVADGEFAAGAHTVEWNADIPSGIYFYRLKAGELSAGRRMVVLR